MGLFHRSCGPLSPMANHATELVQVVGNGWMFPEGLRVRADQGPVHVYMAGFTAVHNAELRYPCLANAAVEAFHQSSTLAFAGLLQIGLLIVTPVAEIVFCRSNRQ